MITIQSKKQRILVSILLMGSLILLLCSVSVKNVTAFDIEPKWQCPYCDYIGFSIQCTDHSKCSYPNDDAEYYRYWCCDCDGNCHEEKYFSGNCRNICQ